MQTTTVWRFSYPLWIWVFGSGFGASLGALLGVSLFPEAGFGQNPIGEFSSSLVGLTLLFGFTLGIVQYLSLRQIIYWHKHSENVWLLCWIPVTVLGILSLVIPLYFFSADAMLMNPILPAIIMLPGACVLGIGQLLVIRRYHIAGLQWVIRTVVGVILGASLGIVISYGFFRMAEPAWASCFGLGVGIFQGNQLSHTFTGLRVPRWLTITTITVIALIFVPSLLALLFFMGWATG